MHHDPSPRVDKHTYVNIIYIYIHEDVCACLSSLLSRKEGRMQAVLQVGVALSKDLSCECLTGQTMAISVFPH